MDLKTTMLAARQYTGSNANIPSHIVQCTHEHELQEGICKIIFTKYTGSKF